MHGRFVLLLPGYRFTYHMLKLYNGSASRRRLLGEGTKVAMVLQGDRVRLRPLERSDLPERLRMVNDPVVKRLSTGVSADDTSELDMYVWFDMYSEDPYSEQWAIEDDAGRYVGDIDLHSIGVMGNEAWINSLFGSEALWSDRALRTDVMRVILQYAFRQKGVDAVHIDIPDLDTVGIAVLKELGFEQTDTYDLDMFTGVQLHTFSVSADMFLARERRSG